MPIKRWKYSDKSVDVSRYGCTCGKKFNFYEGYGKTWTNPRPKIELKSTGMCKGACKKFKVKKPTKVGRYESGQAHCQICDMWVDYKCAHIKGDLPAAEKSIKWFCNCCNNKVKKDPKSVKAREGYESYIDLWLIPSDEEVMYYLCEICKDGKPHAIREILNYITDERKPKGLKHGFGGYWKRSMSKTLRRAIYELKKDDYITNNSRGYIIVTENGRQHGPPPIIIPIR